MSRQRSEVVAHSFSKLFHGTQFSLLCCLQKKRLDKQGKPAEPSLAHMLCLNNPCRNHPLSHVERGGVIGQRQEQFLPLAHLCYLLLSVMFPIFLITLPRGKSQASHFLKFIHFSTFVGKQAAPTRCLLSLRWNGRSKYC